MLVEIGAALEKFGLVPQEFGLLTPDASRFDALLLQPAANIVADKAGVRHGDSAIAMSKFLSFLKLARESKVSLAVTPEYSCPWEALAKSIETGVIPEPGAIWILGCEAARLSSLEALRERLKPHAEVVYEDAKSLVGVERGGFLDPVAYVFAARDTQTKKNRLVVLVQFKTKPMGGNAYEMDNLVLGKQIYVLRNESEHTIKLLTLICSDVLGWDAPECDELRIFFGQPNRVLLCHLQLNKSARHTLYRRYRSTFLGAQGSREAICLNWARNVVEAEPEGKTTTPWRNDSASAVYSRLWARTLMDEATLDDEENRGLYFAYSAELRSFLGVLNFDEFCFGLRLTKVNQDLAPEANRIYRPPLVFGIWSWEESKGWIVAKQPLNPEYEKPMSERGILPERFSALPKRPLRYERLAALSLGKLKDSPAWPSFCSVDAHNVDGIESILRTSFAQDQSDAARQFREQRYSDLSRFIQILDAKTHFPPAMEKFKNADLEFSEGHPFCNLVHDTGANRGTAVFLSDPSKRAAEEVHARLIHQSIAFYASRGIRTPYPAPDHVVIWQVPNVEGPPTAFPPYKPPSLADDPNEAPARVMSSAGS